MGEEEGRGAGAQICESMGAGGLALRRFGIRPFRPKIRSVGADYSGQDTELEEQRL